MGVAGLLASAIWMTVAPPTKLWRPGVLEVVAIDVGQGDSLLIITPEGKTILLDSGGDGGQSHSDFDIGEEVVSPYLWSRGIWRIDVVAISHPHSDHIGGMRNVIANFRPQGVLVWVRLTDSGVRGVGGDRTSLRIGFQAAGRG